MAPLKMNKKLVFLTLLLQFISCWNGLFAQKKEKEPDNFEALALKLTKHATSDSTKVYEIYTWITNNIQYDYRAFMSGEPYRYQSPELVFTKRKTTCTGYTNLMVGMLKAVGIQAMEVEGFTRDLTLGIDTMLLHADHSWLTFQINGSWYLCDPTWDAGYVGLIKDTSAAGKTKRWKRFWEKIISIFSKKKKKETLQKRKKVRYKIGFVRQATRNYISKDPNAFVQSHLPSVAHWQMKTRPISTKEFTDSLFVFNDTLYTDEGTFPYDALNNQYYTLGAENKLLWLSDSVYKYHRLNSSDKAIHAHNYIVAFSRNRNLSSEQKTFLRGIADTVIKHSSIATQLSRMHLVQKKIEFKQAFQQERIHQGKQAKSLAAMNSAFTRSKDIFLRGKNRIQLNEDKTLSNLRQLNFMKFDSNTKLPDSLSGKYKQVIANIDTFYDSLKKVQEKTFHIGNQYQAKSDSLTMRIYTLYLNNQMAIYQSSFINEKRILACDDSITQTISTFERFFIDSMNHLLGNRKSYDLLRKFSVEIRKAEIEINDIALKNKEKQVPAYIALFLQIT
jgi:hypothetical protein